MGELPAVIAVWMLTLEYGVSAAGIARSWADKKQEWLEEDYPTQDFSWLNREYANIFATVVMVASVLATLLGVRFNRIFINTVAVIKGLVVLFIIVAGFALIEPSHLSPFVPERNETTSSFGFQGVITASSLVFYGYTSFDDVCCIAAEVKNPKRVMPIAVLSVVLITMFLSCFASLALSGMTEYTAALSFAAWAAKIVRAGETCTMPIVVLISFFIQPRINYALLVPIDGLMPRSFTSVNSNSVLFFNTLVSGVVLTVVAFIAPFVTLWDIVSFGIFLVLIMANLSLLMVRTSSQSTKAAPITVGVLFGSGFISTFTNQIGWVNHGSMAWYIVSLVFFAVYVTSVLY